jgi:peptidoglycan/xylan/chitin deacetylase (PgdA/CDA1 family)
MGKWRTVRRKRITAALAAFAVTLVVVVSGLRSADAAVALIYHRFDDDRYPSTHISLATFRQQLEWLVTNRFEVWPASRLIAVLERGAEIPDRVAVITIDDGYRSLLGAVSLLEEFQFPFSVFVSTGGIDERVPDLLDWEDLRPLCGRGGEILNHGVDHESLLARPGEADEARRLRILGQVVKAQERIDSELPAACRKRIFSWPYGEFDGLAEETLAGAGYPAFGQQSGPVAAWNSHQALPRFPVNQAFADSALMITKLESLPFPDVLEHSDPVVTENPPSLRLRPFPEIDRVRCFTGSGVPVSRQVAEGSYLFKSSAPLNRGRDRYNCTYPAHDGRRYHWLSQFWYVP